MTPRNDDRIRFNAITKEPMESLPTIIGLIGSAITIGSYALVSTQRLRSDALAYPLANLIGTAMVFYSLLYAWNLPAVVLQVLWIFFSAVGMVRILVRRRTV